MQHADGPHAATCLVPGAMRTSSYKARLEARAHHLPASTFFRVLRSGILGFRVLAPIRGARCVPTTSPPPLCFYEPLVWALLLLLLIYYLGACVHPCMPLLFLRVDAILVTEWPRHASGLPST